MTTEAAVCKHYWLIESPDGIERSEKVRGKCRVCKTERDFNVAAPHKTYRATRKAIATASTDEVE